MHLPTIFITLALVATGVLAQDDGPNFVTKCTTPGEVALTFDDGPSPFTPKLLGYLATAKVSATFFVLGQSINADGGKEALKATYGAGHQIALHSNTHADMNSLSPDKILEEYTINLKAVQDTIAVTPAMGRPPFGNCSATCAKVLQGQMGLTVIQWNADSNDWQYDTVPADQPKLFTNLQNFINPSNPKTDSFITLQHDIKGYSVEYVPKIIEMIKAKGYTFVTVEKCIGLPAYKDGKNAAPIKTAPAPAPKAAAPKVGKASPKASSPNAYVVDKDAKSSSSPSAPAASASSTANATSSAEKVATTFGLTFVGLITSWLMY